jgi:hypothetical protein
MGPTSARDDEVLSSRMAVTAPTATANVHRMTARTMVMNATSRPTLDRDDDRRPSEKWSRGTTRREGSVADKGA